MIKQNIPYCIYFLNQSNSIQHRLSESKKIYLFHHFSDKLQYFCNFLVFTQVFLSSALSHGTITQKQQAQWWQSFKYYILTFLNQGRHLRQKLSPKLPTTATCWSLFLVKPDLLPPCCSISHFVLIISLAHDHSMLTLVGQAGNIDKTIICQPFI